MALHYDWEFRENRENTKRNYGDYIYIYIFLVMRTMKKDKKNKRILD